MELQPTLSGRLVTLTPLEVSDFEELYAVASDPLIWEQHPNKDRFERAVFQKFFDEAMESKGAFAVRDLKTNAIIGSTRYYLYQPEKSEIAIGYTFLSRKYWGGPVNQEMKQLVVRHAFGFVDHTIFHVDPLNFRSQRAMEKLGAEALGPQALNLPNGTSKTSLFYCISKN